jgi:poly(beta-D-mannuronate) lyase
MKITRLLAQVSLCFVLFVSIACATQSQVPAERFDLRFWKLTLPLDDDENGKADEVDTRELARYSHPDFFYIDRDGFLVFTAPNNATTTETSSNTRSELRQMFRGIDTSISNYDPKNNFALEAHPRSSEFADIGGQMEATLKVLHVPGRAKYANRPSAFSVVVGQIHGLKDEELVRSGSGFGYGNEPLKIFYKKWPGHASGSVFWTYERNLERDNPDRRDIAYPVWGNSWDNPDDPGTEGIALGQEFSYNVNVRGNVMYVTFRTTGTDRTVMYQLDLSNNVDAQGVVDEKDNPGGYSGDAMYFKAGNYNQCSTRDSEDTGDPACAGTGDWAIDQANGDFASVAFSRIQLSRSVEPARETGEK